MCEVMRVAVESFMNSMRQSLVLSKFCLEYEAAFCHSMKVMSPPWPSDVAIPFLEFRQIVPSLPSGLIDLINVIGIRELTRRNRHSLFHERSISIQQLRYLTEEVDHQKCIILVCGLTKVERVLSTIVLSIVNASEQVLTQIGQCQDGEMSVDCLNVGTKVRRGESPEDSLSRLLQSTFSQIASIVRISDQTAKETKEMQSKTYKVPTLVTCTTFTAVLTEPIEERAGYLDLECCPGRLEECLGQVSRSQSVDQARHVYKLKRADTWLFFAWLSPEERAHLKSREGHESLKKLLLPAMERKCSL